MSTKYISVKDALPEPFKVVVCLGKPYINRGRCAMFGFHDGKIWQRAEEIFGWTHLRDDPVGDMMFDIDEDSQRITRWMPLPEPPIDEDSR